MIASSRLSHGTFLIPVLPHPLGAAEDASVIAQDSRFATGGWLPNRRPTCPQCAKNLWSVAAPQAEPGAVPDGLVDRKLAVKGAALLIRRETGEWHRRMPLEVVALASDLRRNLARLGARPRARHGSHA